MHGHRNIRPLGYHARPGEHILGSISTRHLKLLIRIESPLLAILEILKGTEQAAQHMANYRDNYPQYDARPSFLICTTPEDQLHTLEAMETEDLCQHARGQLPEIENPANAALIWQLLALRLGAELERLRKTEATNN